MKLPKVILNALSHRCTVYSEEDAWERDIVSWYYIHDNATDEVLAYLLLAGVYKPSVRSVVINISMDGINIKEDRTRSQINIFRAIGELDKAKG